MCRFLRKTATDQLQLQPVSRSSEYIHSDVLYEQEKLARAVSLGHTQCVKWYIEAGADVNGPEKYLHLPLVVAVGLGHEECVKVLADARAGMDLPEKYEALPLAIARLRQKQCVKVLTEAGADVNCLVIYDILSLISATGVGHDEMTKALAKANSHLDMLDEGNCVALMKAIGEGKDKYIEALKNADDYYVYLETRPPLMLATYQYHKECVKLLLQAGADVNCKCVDNSTAMMEAAKFGADDIVKLLAEYGADVNAVNDHADTALMSAAKSYYSQGRSCFKMLLRLGAKINTFNILNRNTLEELICSSYFSREGSEAIRGDCTFLFAAGETLGETPVDLWGHDLSIPDYLLFEDIQFSLKHLCRMTIRKRLLGLKLHIHLFGRVPKLGLPASLSEYLLFGESLEEDGTIVIEKLVTNHSDINYEYDGIADWEIVPPPSLPCLTFDEIHQPKSKK